MSEKELFSVPIVPMLSTGDGNENQASDSAITHVPISVVQRMEIDMNECESMRRQAAKKVAECYVALSYAEVIIGSLKSHLEECSDLGKGPLLGMISSFNQALLSLGKK